MLCFWCRHFQLLTDYSITSRYVDDIWLWLIVALLRYQFHPFKRYSKDNLQCIFVFNHNERHQSWNRRMWMLNNASVCIGGKSVLILHTDIAISVQINWQTNSVVPYWCFKTTVWSGMVIHMQSFVHRYHNIYADKLMDRFSCAVPTLRIYSLGVGWWYIQLFCTQILWYLCGYICGHIQLCCTHA